MVRLMNTTKTNRQSVQGKREIEVCLCSNATFSTSDEGSTLSSSCGGRQGAFKVDVLTTFSSDMEVK